MHGSKRTLLCERNSYAVAVPTKETPKAELRQDGGAGGLFCEEPGATFPVRGSV